jgi:hypothetical protein
MKTAMLRLAVGGLAAAAMLAALPVATAQVPTQDSVVASGFAGGIFTNIDTNVTSGPSGENPTGHAELDAAGQHLASASITCLSVSGNTAVVGGSLQANPFGFAGFVETLVDNGPASAELDAFFAEGTSTVPTRCPPPSPFTFLLFGGDIVVVDAPPLPTSTDQCANGGWQTFGVFKNQGDCVSFVATGGKNPPSAEG